MYTHQRNESVASDVLRGSAVLTRSLYLRRFGGCIVSSPFRGIRGRFLDGISPVLDAVQSDSDDLLQRLCAWRHRQANAAESDSLNENCLPTTARPQRRKRKLKRMAVDLEPPSGDSSQGLPDISKPVALSQPKGSTAEGSQQLCGPPAVRAGASSLCGKRKRSMRERSLESVGHRRSSECCDDMELEESKPHHGEASSSSLSSSESDAGILTNDEGREGDDEQSDFFHEGGPSCWWDELDGELDARFQAILAGSLKHLSPAARQAYHNNAKVGGLLTTFTKSFLQRDVFCSSEFGQHPIVVHSLTIYSIDRL
ncbi:hypothetical protein HPB51_017693 [Rhipicephalus microplus]|uniref:Uncharacterized protein n=1 Tax=Rhipicephalus microplus TaxID=6941 RepID=A0A9J6E257_RHIMP|nr:hypothetical protein HPB51_017693 [Rhipicephalus microplus]